MKNYQGSKLFGKSILMLAALVWGLAFVFQHTGMDHIGPFYFTAIRTGLGAIVLAIVSLFILGKSAFIWTKNDIKVGVICGIFLTGCIMFQQVGLVQTSPGKAGFITALYIILVPITSTIYLKKKYKFKTWLGVCFGLIGLFLLCVTEEFDIKLSDLIVVCCAICFSIHIVVVEKYASNLNAIKLNFIQLAVCSIISLIFALFTESFSFAAVLESREPILYCGIISAAFGCTLQFIGQRDVEPSLASLIMSLEAVFGACFEWIILKNMMSFREITGALIMFIAIIVIEIPEKKRLKENG